METPLDLSEETVLRVVDGPTATTLGDEAVILDPTSGRYFGLDGVGARVWALLERPMRFDTLVAEITRSYDVDEATCARDLASLVTDLREAGLVEVVEETRS